MRLALHYAFGRGWGWNVDNFNAFCAEPTLLPQLYLAKLLKSFFNISLLWFLGLLQVKHQFGNIIIGKVNFCFKSKISTILCAAKIIYLLLLSLSRWRGCTYYETKWQFSSLIRFTVIYQNFWTHHTSVQIQFRIFSYLMLYYYQMLV